MSRKTAVIAGATGLVGRYLTHILIDDAFFDAVTLLTRRPIPHHHPKLQQKQVDFDVLTPDDLAGATHLFCALGTTIRKAGGEKAFRQVDYEYPLNVAKAGIEAGARHMALVSSVGADPKAPAFYLRTKGELEQSLRALPLETLHIFRPSILMGARDESRPGEALGITFARAFEWALIGGLRKYRPMPAPMLAQAMAVAAERGPSGVRVYQYDDIKALAI